jgi:peptidoglycan/xylan/chitin deacetylase (PgdA/CDA1 family)
VARSLELPAWPGGARVAVSLTFDVDGDPAWRGMDPRYDRRLSTLSQFRFGLVRGLPRVLRLLDDRSIQATFYVPGSTADAYPDAVREIAAAGHEVGHHGYDHVMPHAVDPARQRDEIERGIAALVEVTGERPRGYRAPCAELTPETLALLLEHDFRYDSSCMGDDRPYVEEFGGMAILELPMHWSLDDAPYFLFTAEARGLLRSPDDVVSIWLSEFRAAWAERRHVTYVMHPEIIGRGPQIDALSRFLDDISQDGDVWFATHADVAAVLTELGRRQAGTAA